MNQTELSSDSAIREIPFSQLALAPENVRKTLPDDASQTELQASLEAHGLLENLVVRSDGPGEDGAERYAVVAGGRRLAALGVLVEEGVIPTDFPVPCKVVANDNASELSLAENMVRIVMHPADQVIAFSQLAGNGMTVAAIAARFGVSERIVEQRLRLGDVAPELLDAYRAGRIGLEALKAFTITTDWNRQRAAWEQISNQGCSPAAWAVKQILSEEHVPAVSAIARFVGVDAYEAAGGAVLRDLFADEDDKGVWLEDPALLNDLAMKKLTGIADELSTRWKWAHAMPEANWRETAHYGRIHPQRAEPTDEERAETERLQTRFEEINDMDGDDLTQELLDETDDIEARLDDIEAQIDARATFRPEDFAVAGCIATIGYQGELEVIQGLVRPEDMPKDTAGDTAADGGDPVRIDSPSVSTPVARMPDPGVKARQEAGVGVGLADDLRAVRTALVKAHLGRDFEAAFDLMLFQLGRAVFAQGHSRYSNALDIVFKETADRPPLRMNDDEFAAWSPGEAMLEEHSQLPFEWMEQDDDAACFAALRALPQADKEELFAAAVARTVQGQLAFEPGGRPELEATVARLGIDFAKHVRPTADMLWSRIRKDRLLDIARRTLGPAWASARAKYKKSDLAKAMQEAFADGPAPVGLPAAAHAAALAWTVPGFAAFDMGRAAEDAEAETGKPATAAATDADADAGNETAPPEEPRTTSAVERIEAPGVAERRAADLARGNGVDGNGAADPAHAEDDVEDDAESHRVNSHDAEADPVEVPEFLRHVH